MKYTFLLLLFTCQFVHAQNFIAYQTKICSNSKDTVCVSKEIVLNENLCLSIDTIQNSFILSIFQIKGETKLVDKTKMKGNILNIYLSENTLLVTSHDRNYHKGTTCLYFLDLVNLTSSKKNKEDIIYFLGYSKNIFYFLSSRKYKKYKYEKVNYILAISGKSKQYLNNPIESLQADYNEELEIDFFNGEYYAFSNRHNRTKTIFHRNGKEMYIDKEIAIHYGMVYEYNNGLIFYSYKNKTFYYIKGNLVNSLFRMDEFMDDFPLKIYLVDFAIINGNIVAVVNVTYLKSDDVGQTNKVLLYNLRENKVMVPSIVHIPTSCP